MKIFAALAFVTMLNLAACGGDQTAAVVDASHSEKLKSSMRSVQVADYRSMVQSLYVSYFGRPADPAGLTFYSEQYRNAGSPAEVELVSAQYGGNPAIRVLVDSFSTSKESMELYPGSDEEFMTHVYANMFGRAPDPAGKSFWIGALNAGAITRASAVISILGGARGADRELINFKTAVAMKFTETVAAIPGIYSGNAPNATARAMLLAVTAVKDTAYIDQLIASTTASLTPVIPSSGVQGFAQADRSMPQSQIDFVCISGRVGQTTTNADGTFSLTIASSDYPCVIRATGVGSQAGLAFHSIAHGGGPIRVSPITDAVMAIAAMRNIDGVNFTTSPHFFTLLSPARLQIAKAQLRTLLPVGMTLPTSDPFSFAGGDDPFAVLLGQIRALLVKEDLDWEDAIDYVVSGHQLEDSAAFVTSMSPRTALPGDTVEIRGKNFPTVPAAQITLIDSAGKSFVAQVVGATNEVVSYRVPAAVHRGTFIVIANGARLLEDLFINIPDPTLNHPFYQSGKQRQRILSGYMHAADGINQSFTGTLFKYPGRKRTIENCSVRVNPNGSIDRLDKDNKVITSYSWESVEDSAVSKYPRLYSEPSTRASMVEIVSSGGSIPANSFIFRQSHSDIIDDATYFDLCVGAGVDGGFQFFAGPAMANWKRMFPIGVYGSEERWVYNYVAAVDVDNFATKYSAYEPVYVSQLNRTFQAGLACGITVADGSVSFWLDKKENTVASVSISDNFKYEPPVNGSQFSESEIFIPPAVPVAENFRLLSERPFVFSGDPKFVLEWRARNGADRASVRLYFGVKEYDYFPGKFRSDGYVDCSVLGKLI